MTTDTGETIKKLDAAGVEDTNVVHLIQEGMAKLLQEREQHLNDELRRRTVREWFERLWPDRTVTGIGPLRIPKGGASNEMYAFAVETDTGTEQVVLRMEVPDLPIAPPLGESPRPVVAVEHAVQSALAMDGTSPVAPLLGYENDPSVLGRPFYAMGWVPGDVLPTANPGTSDLLTGLSPAQRTVLVLAGVEAIAAAHRLDWRTAGLGWMLPEGGVPSVVAEQLSAYRRFTERFLRGAEHPVMIAALDWLEAHQPRVTTAVLTHGDARLGNQVFNAQGRVAATLDWELTAILPPTMDLAHWLMTDFMVHEVEGNARLEGYPTRSEQLDHWERCYGGHAADLGFWETFCAVKTVYVFLRVVRRMQDQGALDDRADALLQENFAARFLADHLGSSKSVLL